MDFVLAEGGDGLSYFNLRQLHVYVPSQTLNIKKQTITEH
jgi:hypothetical protein